MEPDLNPPQEQPRPPKGRRYAADSPASQVLVDLSMRTPRQPMLGRRLVRTAAPAWLTRGVAVSFDLCFDGSRFVLRGGKFSLGDLDAEFLPLPKLIGNVLRRFRLLDRSTATRLHFSLKDEKPPVALRYHSDEAQCPCAEHYRFDLTWQRNSPVKLDVGAAG